MLKNRKIKATIASIFCIAAILVSGCNNWSIHKPFFEQYGDQVQKKMFCNTIKHIHDKSCFSFVGNDYKDNCEIIRIESAETHITNEDDDLDYSILEQENSNIVVDKKNNRISEESNFKRRLSRKDKKTTDIKAHSEPGKRKYYYEKAKGNKGYVVDLTSKTATLFISRFFSLERMAAYAESNRNLKVISKTISLLLAYDGINMDLFFEEQNHYYSTRTYYVNNNVFTFVGDNMPNEKSIIQIQYGEKIRILAELYLLSSYSGYREESTSYLEVSIAKSNRMIDAVDFSNYPLSQDY